ncbi:bifunctional tRNA (5-methylaminomethyl-2-thiouridine)(34)-methyltransferase MnmD/FAD-dependent 5-carboxymethylaminomethyl-2-thiouridine(34) oxidoreductase MnmC [Marinimicrobium agarilyticum]|uniref:bifunctional tRNA (5-methylaminomethyl-2-thiouridine)(34)-methyltransferase MnmD/FAD-dependent 5-carboxymethylaminomethyl-2-thiouridine(34) oxidoreductase MnmC n=1 Tax=Marinimicrobium agarilyticum TaxID=306546 RepID=UPI00041328DD|nr:bifunctional tRNA (5-methylaminomethyl-2-thiouridine)(34)-methyltransferase MnmD/FAD-dependent 5-carboxymethylaminomethyl-2-thiouridine(34) oxidoreductase MnmC [Marinimicrobium agarilyticum]
MSEPEGPHDEITCASLSWDEEGQPLSDHFDDVYFSRHNGLEETRYVFLAQNHLAQRFSALLAKPPGARHFVIGETGFGSGLNFLAAWQLWRETAPPDAQLHFISVDKFPLARSDLKRALALWPELAPLSQALLAHYPPTIGPGFHRRHFDDGRVSLTLIFDDASRGLGQLRASEHPDFVDAGLKVNAWFLDGFAPAKNADMWAPSLFSTIAHLSAPGTTVATFTAAGVVKRELQRNGFELKKLPGFGHKREMLTARYVGNTDRAEPPHRFHGKPPLPWSVPSPNSQRSASAPHTALVVGAGLAGCHTARALAQRGWQVTVLDRRSGPAQEASGNPQGLLYAKLSPQNSPLARFNLLSLCHAQEHYRAYWQAGVGESCGVLQLATANKEESLQPAIARRFAGAPELVRHLSPLEASDVAGIPLYHSALFFPKAGWLDPRRLCEALLDHPSITLRPDSSVDRLEQEENQWWALGPDGAALAGASVAVLANAHAARHLCSDQALPLKAIRGQITQIPANATSRRLRVALCGDGYLAPAASDYHCLGATFNLGDTNPEVTERDHRANLEQLSQFGPEVGALFGNEPPETAEGRVAFRCATPDYLPLVGPVPDVDAFLRDYAPLRKDARLNLPVAGQYRPGLYLNLGHGSRGLCYTPLSAELLAAHVTGEPMPLDNELVQALHPARFMIRDLMRNKR